MNHYSEKAAEFESTTVGVFRTAATVKGGRRFSFSSLVVVGDRSGRVGVGYGKANQVPPAIEKAQKEARRKMRAFPLQGRTIPHVVTGRFGACSVRLVPASPGTGVIAGAAVRAPLEMLGVQDCLTKSYGSNNPKNLVKAVINGLEQLRDRGQVQALRHVDVGPTEVEDAIQRGQAFHPEPPPVPRPPAPQAGPGRRPAGGPGGGGRGGKKTSRRRKPAPSRGPAKETPAPDTAPAETTKASEAPAASKEPAPAPAPSTSKSESQGKSKKDD